MYASLYKIPTTSILDNRKFINSNSLFYEAPPKVNKYVPDETIEEKVNYSYGPNLKDRGAGEVYSYRYDSNYVGNRDVDNGIISTLDMKKRPYNPVSIIQLDRLGKDKLQKGNKGGEKETESSKESPKGSSKESPKGNKESSKGDNKESYEEKSSKSSKSSKEGKDDKDDKDGKDGSSSGTCSTDSSDTGNICGNNKLYPIMDPRFNLREASKNMILLEDHLFHMGKRCKDCILKHCLIIEGFLEEGITLDVDGIYTPVLEKAFDNFRVIFIEIANKCKSGSLTNEDCIKIAQQVRKIRKPLCQDYATFIK